MEEMPPLTSPQVVDVVASGDANGPGGPGGPHDPSGPDGNNGNGSPPATVISLTPAQPYPPGTVFAAPAYDLASLTAAPYIQVSLRRTSPSTPH